MKERKLIPLSGVETVINKAGKKIHVGMEISWDGKSTGDLIKIKSFMQELSDPLRIYAVTDEGITDIDHIEYVDPSRIKRKWNLIVSAEGMDAWMDLLSKRINVKRVDDHAKTIGDILSTPITTPITNKPKKTVESKYGIPERLKLNIGEKIYLDKAKTKESRVNDWLEHGRAEVYAYEYQNDEWYWVGWGYNRLFWCADYKIDAYSIVKQEYDKKSEEWIETVIEFNDDELKLFNALFNNEDEFYGRPILHKG